MHNINRKSKNTLLQVGSEKTPVIIIDNFLLDTSAAIKEAVNSKFIAGKEHNNYYPGVRTPVGSSYGMAVLKAIAPIFYQIIKVPKNLTLFPKNGSYALLTQAEKELELLQCIPHFDDNLIYSFAVLHYLNPGNFGGTGIYRHKPTGYENITEQRKEHYFTQAQAFIDTNGNPEQKYFTDSTSHYELLETIEYKENRLVIYPTTLLHSAYIKNPSHDVNDDPKTGRLTANFFIEFTK